MAEEIIEETIVGGGDKPSTFADDLYNASIQSGFIPKDATFDRFKENLKIEAFVKDAFNFSLESGLIPKDATYDRFTKNLSGTNPAEKKNGTEKPVTALPADGGSSGLRKIEYKGQQYEYNPKTGEAYKEGRPVDIATQAFIDKNILGILDKNSTVDRNGNPIDQKPFQQGLLDRQQGAISAAEAPDVQSEKIIKRNKKFPSFRDNPQIGAALDAYQNLKTAAANTADKQNEYELFLKTGTFTDENGQDIRPMGALPTDRLGNTAVVPDSPAANVKSTLEANLKKAKEDEDIAYNDLGDKENTFRKAKLPELPVKKGLGGDKYEYEMPSQVKVLTFMDDLSKLEDYANNDLGMSLKQYSDSIENVTSDAFLNPTQQSLFTELNSGDERAARSAIARYDDDINSQIVNINKMLTGGSLLPAERANLINKRQTLTDQKSDFFSPKKAIEGAMTINPQLKPIFDAFAGIGDQDKASLVYAKLFKDSQDLAQNLTGEPLFIDKDGKQVLNPSVTNYLVAPPRSAAKQNILDDRERLQKNINTMQILAPATLLNRRPIGTSKENLLSSMTKTMVKGLVYDSGFTDVMHNSEKPAFVYDFLSDAIINPKDLPTSQQKTLKDVSTPNIWERTGTTLGYLIPAAVELATGAGELKAIELFAGALRRSSTVADIAYDLLKLTKGDKVLSNAIKMGTEAQLGGVTFHDPEMGFLNIGAESLTGELIEKGLKKLPGGAAIGKLAKKIFGAGKDINNISRADIALNTISKINAFGLAEVGGEGIGTVVQLYQDSPTWKEFKDKFNQQFGKLSSNVEFFATCYTLGGVFGNHAAPATQAVLKKADEAYQKLSPEDKKIADQIVENDVDATNVAIVSTVRNSVKSVPNTDLDVVTEQATKAKGELDAITDVSEEKPYEVKFGNTTLSGTTPEQLANDKDLINSLDIIYGGEKQRRQTEGVTVETPTNTEQVQQQPVAEEGVGVEGAVVPEVAQPDVADIERRRKEELTPYDERDKNSIEAITPNNPNHPTFKVGQKFNQGMHVTVTNTQAAENYDGRDNDYEAITKIVEPAEFGEDGKMTKAAKVEVTLFNTKEDADAAIQKKLENVKAKVGKKQKEINAKYDAELAALNAPTTTTQPSPINAANAPETVQNAQENGQNVTEPTQAPVIKAQVVGTTNGFNTIIDGGLGKQQDPRFTGEVQQGKSIFKVQPNNNESSFLDISLPSSDSFGRSGGIQIRFELPNGVDANTVFEAVKKEAAKVGSLDAKDPNFKQTVQGLVDKGIAKIQGLATGGAKQTAQVKETVSEKQVPPTTTSENPALKNVQSTATALSKIDKSVIDATLPLQPLEIDGYKREYRNDSPVSIAEAYHKAKADKSNPDLVKAVEELLAPKGESKNNNVNSQNGNKENKSQKPNPTVVQQAKEADTEGDDTVARNKAKRASVKSALKKLRDDGLLKTADKTLIGKAKKLLGVKSAPMSDAEIDAQMALLDAMADVWKNTTGKDNFYETFIGDIRKGDLSELKKMGGVLFQDTENPAAPTSRLTLAVFEQPLFEKMKGSMVAPQAISDLVKSRGKQIEKDIINMVLDFDKYKGQKRISFDEFRGDVETQIMKLEKIRTRSYADYGYINLGDNENYGDTETVIFNSPIEHGQKGHFSGDFTTKGLDKTEWELRQIPNTDQWAAMDKNMPAGVTAENIAGYIGTAGEKAEVEKWISDRNKENDGGINQGLFGHIRKWFNKRDGIFHIAELQSDYYQKNKASDLMKPKVSDDEVNAHMNKNVWQPIDKEIADKIKNDWGITTKNDGDVIFAYDRNGQQIASEIIENPKIGLERGQFEQNNVIIEALDTLASRETLDKKLDDGTYQVYTRNGNVIFKTEQEAQQFIKSYDGRFNGAKDAYNATKEAYYEKRRGLQQVEEQKFIQKRQEELAKDKPTNIQLKQFVASQKVHELRLLREAIKMAAEDGAETVRFPSQYTLAVIEGYTDATGEGEAPYEIISGDSDRLYEGDEIDYGGERMIVVAQDRSTITVAPKNEVSVMNYNDLLESETDNRVDEIEYEAKRHFDDLDAITREELDNYEPDEWLGGTAKDLLEGYFADNEDAETVKWDDIKSELYDSVRERHQGLQVDDLVGWSGTVWMDGDTIYALEGRNYENFNQPYEYEASSSKDDYYENLSRDQKTVVDKYGELAEQFQKMRPDARTVVDENGMEWLETTVTEADKNNPIVAFQKEGDKVKGAVDFTNNNKATIYIFDGADITTLAHEMSGHLGRRVLEKLASADPDFAKQYKAVKKWAGVKDVWTTKAEEKFARGFERYLREGKAPTTALKDVFGKLKEWLSGVYKVIKGSSIDIELTDDVRNVFDTLLGKEKTTKNETGQAKPIGESPQDVTGNIGTDKNAAEKTKDQRKADFTTKVDDLAAKLKAKMGTDPNVVKMGLGADDVVDFIASVVKEAGRAAIDVAEAIKTAKAKLKELGVSDALINEAEAKYTGKEQAIPTETIDNLIKGNRVKNALESIPDAKVAEAAKVISDKDKMAKIMDILNSDDPRLFELQEKLGFKKIC